MSNLRRKGARGFTLIEVLVALAVLAIALTAIFKSLGQAVDLSAGLRDRTVALWVAQDVLALRRMSGGVPAVGARSGQRDVAGRQWTWTETAREETPGVRRLEIGVTAAGGEHQLARLVSFVGI